MDSNDIVISIIIVNWNVIKILEVCLNSIKQYLCDTNFEVIVIDNASSDDSCKTIREDYPWVKLIENDENQGFARANNQGFKIAKGRYILILNPDTIIKDSAIQKMLAFLETNQHFGMVGPRILNEKGCITPPCKRAEINLVSIFFERFLFKKIFFWTINFVSPLRRHYEKRFYKSEPTKCIQGACMLIRKKSLAEIGYFDENVPMYLDDRDMCYRFNKQKATVYYLADSEIVHYCGASTAKANNPKLVDLLVYEAADVFFRKHKNISFIFAHHVILLVSSLLFLSIDLLALPFMIFFNKGYARSVIEKHIDTLYYSVSSNMLHPHFKRYRKAIS